MSRARPKPTVHAIATIRDAARWSPRRLKVFCDWMVALAADVHVFGDTYQLERAARCVDAGASMARLTFREIGQLSASDRRKVSRWLIRVAAETVASRRAYGSVLTWRCWLRVSRRKRGAR